MYLAVNSLTSTETYKNKANFLYAYVCFVFFFVFFFYKNVNSLCFVQVCIFLEKVALNLVYMWELYISPNVYCKTFKANSLNQHTPNTFMFISIKTLPKVVTLNQKK